MRELKFSITIVLWIIVAGLAGCASFLAEEENTTPFVLLAQHDKAGRCLILVKDLKLNVSIVPKGALPYSENASAALWIGTEFDYSKALNVLKFCRNYYPHIKYIALSDLSHVGQNRGRYEMYLGASTDRALCLGLKVWTVRDKKRLLKTRSKEQFQKLIRSKYGNPKRCLDRRED